MIETEDGQTSTGRRALWCCVVSESVPRGDCKAAQKREVVPCSSSYTMCYLEHGDWFMNVTHGVARLFSKIVS